MSVLALMLGRVGLRLDLHFLIRSLARSAISSALMALPLLYLIQKISNPLALVAIGVPGGAFIYLICSLALQSTEAKLAHQTCRKHLGF